MSVDFLLGLAAGFVGAYVAQALAMVVAEWWVGRTEGEQQ